MRVQARRLRRARAALLGARVPLLLRGAHVCVPAAVAARAPGHVRTQALHVAVVAQGGAEIATVVRFIHAPACEKRLF